MSDIKSIAQIKQEFEQSGDDKEALYVQYAGDSRKGVQNLITKYQKEAQKLVKERERLETMRFFEHKYSEYHAICGIDEAGRGPLAGPVVAGAVILPEDNHVMAGKGMNDPHPGLEIVIHIQAGAGAKKNIHFLRGV